MSNSLYLIRHAPTKLNAGEGGAERSRGWGDYPPNPEDLDRIVPQVASFLKDKGITKLVSSDLPRAAITAKHLASALGIKAEPSARLRTWKTGFDGQEESKVESKKRAMIAHPEVRPANGESFQSFADRWGSELRKLMRHNEEHPDEQHAAVIHGNMGWIAPHLANESEVKPEHYDTESAKPGSVSVLRWDGDSKATYKTLLQPK